MHKAMIAVVASRLAVPVGLSAQFVLPIALALLASSPGLTQPLQSFQDLPLRVNLDDRLQVEDQSGMRTTGRLTRLTREEITLSTDAGEKRFTNATVREVAVRRRSLRKGVLIGAGVGAALGALAACGGPERSECADGPIMLGALGAGVGLVVSAAIPRVTIVYRAPIDMAPSRGLAPPPGLFDDLALQVNLDDRLRIEDQSGTRTTGRLTRLTGDEMTIETDAGERRFTGASVREVAVRGYSLGKRTLIGAGIGAGVFAVLAAAAPTCRSNPNCTPIGAAPFGAGVGLALGALIPQMTTVFRAQEQGASSSLAFSLGALGARPGPVCAGHEAPSPHLGREEKCSVELPRDEISHSSSNGKRLPSPADGHGNTHKEAP
jgi:hypothetical protein